MQEGKFCFISILINDNWTIQFTAHNTHEAGVLRIFFIIILSSSSGPLVTARQKKPFEYS